MFTLWNLLCIEKLGIIFDLGPTYFYAKLNNRVIYSFNQFHIFAISRLDFFWGHNQHHTFRRTYGLTANTDILVSIQTILRFPIFPQVRSTTFLYGLILMWKHQKESHYWGSTGLLTLKCGGMFAFVRKEKGKPQNVLHSNAAKSVSGRTSCRQIWALSDHDVTGQKLSKR